jgi:hypothetical protein
MLLEEFGTGGGDAKPYAIGHDLNCRGQDNRSALRAVKICWPCRWVWGTLLPALATFDLSLAHRHTPSKGPVFVVLFALDAYGCGAFARRG